MSRSTLYCQPSTPDSLRKIEVVKWRVERLIHDALLLRSLQEYVTRLEAESDISAALIVKLDSALVLKDQIITQYTNENSLWRTRYQNQKEITRQERKAKRKWIVVAGLMGIAAGASLVYD